METIDTFNMSSRDELWYEIRIDLSLALFIAACTRTGTR